MTPPVQSRFLGLIASGVPVTIAHLIATKLEETLSAIAHILGDDRAKDAAVGYSINGTRLRIHLSGSIAGLTKLQIRRLKTELGIRINTVH